MNKAIIVGASSGLGKELALLFLRDGWKVGICARRADKLEEIRALFPDQVVCSTIDVTSENSARSLHALIDELGGLDIYIHSSGIGYQNQSLDEDIEELTVQTNVAGFRRMVDEVFRYYRDNGIHGKIAAITSLAGTRGMGAAPAYSATKAFQSWYLEALEQLSARKGYGIGITDIRPGFVATDMISKRKNYPMKLSAQKVAKDIYRSVLKGRHVRIIDWKFRIIGAIWKMVPRKLWRNIPVV